MCSSTRGIDLVWRRKNGKNEESCEKVSVKVVSEALNLMKIGKVARPSGVISELLKVCKNESVKTLAKVTDNFFKEKKCLKVGERAT